MSTEQMVWHAYYTGSLCQYVNLEARRAQIEQIKPPHELPTRRQLMKLVIGQLPAKFVAACEKEAAAKAAVEAAVEAAAEAAAEAAVEAAAKVAKAAARAAWEAAKVAKAAAWKAWAVKSAAWEAQEAREVSYQTHKTEIERLHTLECPDCSWDGETIFLGITEQETRHDT